jgi:hypothetical protein
MFSTFLLQQKSIILCASWETLFVSISVSFTNLYQIDFCCNKNVENIGDYRDSLELNIGETILNIFDHAYEKESAGKYWVLFHPILG